MALGVILTRGYTTAVEAADAMCKDAQIEVKEVKVPGGGHVTLLTTGEVAAVISAVEAGVEAAGRVGGDIISSFVIPNPHPELATYLWKKEENKNG